MLLDANRRIILQELGFTPASLGVVFVGDEIAITRESSTNSLIFLTIVSVETVTSLNSEVQMVGWSGVDIEGNRHERISHLGHDCWVRQTEENKILLGDLKDEADIKILS